jgi:DNA-binding MarR family transcriptional regulator
MFFKSMVKRVIQDLNDKGLIRRYSGSADVLNPTSNLIQIYTLNGVKKTRE